MIFEKSGQMADGLLFQEAFWAGFGTQETLVKGITLLRRVAFSSKPHKLDALSTGA